MDEVETGVVRQIAKIVVPIFVSIGGLACACITVALLMPVYDNVGCGTECHWLGLAPAPAWVVTIIAVGAILGMIPLIIRYIYHPYQQVSLPVAFLVYSAGGIVTIILFIGVGIVWGLLRDYRSELFFCCVLPTAFIGLMALLRHILPQEPKQKRKRNVHNDK